MARPTLKALLETPAVQLILTSRKLTELPDTLRRRHEIAHLGLTRNQLHSLPDWISELPSLASLYLSDNPLESLPDAIGDLPSLDRLRLDGTALRALPAALARSPLTDLTLDRLPTLDWAQAFAVLARCPRLSSLALNGNPSVAPHLDGLRPLAPLNALYLSECGLTEVPASLAALPSLAHLSLASNPLTHVPDALVLAPSLTSLVLSKSRVGAAERRRIKALRPSLAIV